MSRREPERKDWADPGYFRGGSFLRNGLRLLLQLIRPPRGHRTLPTRAGFVFIAVTIGVGTAAFNTGQNILYLVLAMLLSTLLVSGVLSWMNFKGCRWRLEVSRHTRVGEVSPVCLEVHNCKRWLPSLSLEFVLLAGSERVVLVLRQALAAGQRQRLLWDWVPQRRGSHQVVLDRMVSAFPFGFLRKSIRESLVREVLVWPARLDYRCVAQRRGNRARQGQHRRRGSGVDLRQLRPYRPGDPLRSVSWKTSARMGALHVRETDEDHQQAFSLWIDPSPHLWDAAGFERMCSLAGSLAEDWFTRDQLRMVQVAGEPALWIRDQENLYLFLDTLSRLERRELPVASAFRTPPAGAVQLRPDAAGRVVILLDGEAVGDG